MHDAAASQDSALNVYCQLDVATEGIEHIDKLFLTGAGLDELNHQFDSSGNNPFQHPGPFLGSAYSRSSTPTGRYTSPVMTLG
jgi:hypothetical protein